MPRPAGRGGRWLVCAAGNRIFITTAMIQARLYDDDHCGLMALLDAVLMAHGRQPPRLVGSDFVRYPPPNAHLSGITTPCFPVASHSCFLFPCTLIGACIFATLFRPRLFSFFSAATATTTARGCLRRGSLHTSFPWVDFPSHSGGVCRLPARLEFGLHGHVISFSRHKDDSFFASDPVH